MKFHKPVFDRIDGEKRKRLLDAAAAEFARKGFTGANVNRIAERASISVGAIYKYFETKEDLFLSVVHRGIAVLEATLQEIEGDDRGFFEKIETLIRTVQEHSRRDPDMINLYNEMTSEGNAELVRRLSRDMETISSRCYAGLIRQAREGGELPPDSQERMGAFFLDNLFLTLQFSYASDYYKERMAIFLGPEALRDDEAVVRGLMTLIRRAFS